MRTVVVEEEEEDDDNNDTLQITAKKNLQATKKKQEKEKGVAWSFDLRTCTSATNNVPHQSKYMFLHTELGVKNSKPTNDMIVTSQLKCRSEIL